MLERGGAASDSGSGREAAGRRDGAELEALRALVRQTTDSPTCASPAWCHAQRCPGILAATDIALVTLKPSEVFKTVLPSKMFEAMAARCPIVLGVDGEAKATLERAGAGIAVEPGSVEALTRAIVDLAADPERRASDGAGRSRLRRARVQPANLGRTGTSTFFLD